MDLNGKIEPDIKDFKQWMSLLWTTGGRYLDMFKLLVINYPVPLPVRFDQP
ncbi:uncharacterized protein RCO7_14551 [Rhynchosporium graminicola]|uniref:Uncharacterized protein n=1 Tax=Rhynchosporium graminicola TaxID=2792576 RepID=A0A1E1KNH2_9HELO|nr:uncharacterized protein RCO7_14551 [Rhynchosporium commune]